MDQIFGKTVSVPALVKEVFKVSLVFQTSSGASCMVDDNTPPFPSGEASQRVEPGSSEVVLSS